MGKLRDEIMAKCPEGFEDDLKDFIDTVEGTINSAKNEIDIKGISDIGGIGTGFDIISELADDLY